MPKISSDAVIARTDLFIPRPVSKLFQTHISRKSANIAQRVLYCASGPIGKNPGKKKAATGRRRGPTNIFGGMGNVCRNAHFTKSAMSLEVIKINILITKYDIEIHQDA